MNALLLVVTLLAAAEDKTWEDIAALGDDTSSEAAKARLKAGLPKNLDAMAKALKVSGAEATLWREHGMRLCMGFMSHMGLPTPGSTLLSLLIDWAKADAALAKALWARPEAVLRLLALAATARTPLGDELLKAAEKDTSAPLVRKASELAMSCRAAMAPSTNGTALAQRAEALEGKTGQVMSCETASEAPTMASQLDGREVVVSSWGQSNFKSYINLKSGHHLGTACATEVYKLLVAKGRYVPALLIPTLGEHSNVTERSTAAELAQRDFEKFEAEAQKKVSTALLTQGYSAPKGGVKVDIPDDVRFTSPDQLIAAVRQGDARAKDAIQQRWRCRGFQLNEEAALLGWVPSKENADAAVAVAKSCKEGAPGAVAALARMKDPRAFELLPLAMEDTFGLEVLGRTLREIWTVQWADAVKAQRAHKNYDRLARATGLEK